MEQRIVKTLENFRRNGFQTQRFASGREAADWLAEQVPAGAEASFGGSVTLTELDLRAKLEARGVKYLDYRDEALGKETLEHNIRQCFFAHSYFLSANAVTEDGYILNVDGTGNRIAASVFGPQNIYFVVGQNKLAPDLAAAVERVEQVAAPQNVKRLHYNNPCVQSAVCEHCGPQTSICRAWLLLKYAPKRANYIVVWIDEDLGY